jgi:arylsulfatase
VYRPGSVQKAFVHVMDLAPTFLELAGATYPSSWEGREITALRGKSLVRILSGESTSVRGDDEPVGWELLGWRALRVGQWKTTWIDRPFGTSSWQLFDLSNDPGETTDLHSTQPERMQDMVRMWDEYEREVGIIYAEEDLPISF